jgi:hypothetical protein
VRFRQRQPERYQQTTLDTIDEVDETFNIANGTVSTTGTILDDDVALTITCRYHYSEINCTSFSWWCSD